MLLAAIQMVFVVFRCFNRYVDNRFVELINYSIYRKMLSTLRDFSSELRADFSSEKAVPALSAGLELAANQELDWDREFRVTGVASLAAGLGGGTVATIIVPASLRSKLLGASTRLTGLVAALVIGGALFLGDGMLEFVPAPLVGGILIFTGLGLLDQGLVASCKRLP